MLKVGLPVAAIPYIDSLTALIIYNAFVDKRVKGLPRYLLPTVHEHYFKPEYEEFEARNLWSMSNAFTSAFKKLLPVKQFEVTARLGSFMTEVQKDLKQNTELKFELQRPKSEESSTGLSSIARTSEINLQNSLNGSDNSGRNLQLPTPQHHFGFIACGKNDIVEDHNYNEDDIAEDPYEREEFDEYFDADEESETINEAEEELLNEFMRRAA